MDALSAIDAPADLRKLARAQLPDLATQLRDFVLHSVAATGGHLASNLGSVELAIALHYVFDTPRDRIVWDVGHQSCPHKILTGRREAMKTLRQSGGISGFPRRSESPYDAFGTAHSSTSISAVLGMAHAARINGEARHCVAVIGDGALSAGIAEQHAITFAGGLAADGLKPVVAIYSTFLQRGYDQLIHDIAIQRLPVTFAIDRAGIVGADGATHMGAFDIAFLRCIPDLVLMAPADENECRQMLHTALDHDGPAAVRYPRGCGPGVPPVQQMQPIPIGKGAVIRTSSQPPGARIAILAFGSMVEAGLKAGKQLDATVANMRFIRPLDIDLVRTLADQHDVLVTVEEGCVAGGAGSACLEVLAAHRVPIPVLQLGLPDQFVEHGDPAMLLAACGLDVDGLVQSIDRFFSEAAAPCRSPRTMTHMSLAS
ncbi:1-deoxy-D-xylulose-5-phosphate synthase [Burkholderia cenocepacia]|nr:1-deoxy-D-xylulose-5-phosphate synthase [Burkholderia cenocepacia]RQU11665.1 1-deoxy-D-xylulose-5-phosphate synthase [Burkholderia cenocepacia]